MKSLFVIISLLFACSNSINAQTRNIRMPEKPKRTTYTDVTSRESGYWYAIELTGGSMTDAGRRNLSFAEGTIINGYRLNEFLRAGLGFGVKYYIDNDDVRSSSIPWAFPLYADFRGNIISQQDRSLVPYWSFDIGAEIRNGFFFSPTIGVRIGEGRSSFLVGLNYRYGSVKTWKDDNDMRSMFALKLGYEF